MTGTYDHWLDYAKNKDAEVQHSEFVHTCSIGHNDGSLFYFPSALVEEKDYFFVIFTKHLGYFVFDKENVTVMWGPG